MVKWLESNPLVLFFQKEKGVLVVHTCNPSTKEVERGVSGVEDQSQPHSKFKASLGCTGPCVGSLTTIERGGKGLYVGLGI